MRLLYNLKDSEKMTNPKYQIAPLTEGQILSAGEVLTQAFLPDALCVYTFPDLEARTRAFSHFFLASVREGAFLHSVYSTVGQTEGVAVWSAPNAHELTLEQREQTGFNQMEEQFGTEPYKRFIDVFSAISHAHTHAMPEPHWYLSLLGVSPRSQGRGIGSALLAPVLQQADKEGIPCYLETFRARNVTFYQHHGFHITESGIEPQSQISYWAMRREPQTSH
jgi:GNAT superfamily N-acetyltransferase